MRAWSPISAACSVHPRLAHAPRPCRLTNRSMPCVAVGNGKVLLPPELCVIVPGQVGSSAVGNGGYKAWAFRAAREVAECSKGYIPCSEH